MAKLTVADVDLDQSLLEGHYNIERTQKAYLKDLERIAIFHGFEWDRSDLMSPKQLTDSKIAQ